MPHIVFIHIPKTGGNSIVAAFEEALRGRFDLVFHHVGHQNLSYYLEQRARVEAYPLDPKTLYFTVTRNPYTRFVSAYHHNTREKDSDETKMDINTIANDLRNHYTPNYWRQTWFIEGRDHVNFRFFQLENLNILTQFFRVEYGLNLAIPLLNVNPHPGPSILNDHSRLVVSLWFGEDFTAFGYDSTQWNEESNSHLKQEDSTLDGKLVIGALHSEARSPFSVLCMFEP